MNEKEATNAIKTIENKFSEKIEINGKNFWPLLRALLYLKFFTSSKKNKKTNEYKQNFFQSFKGTVKNLKNFNILNSKIKNKENIFFSRVLYLQKLKKNNFKYDRIFDALLHDKKIFKNSSKIYLSYNDLNGNFAIPFLRTYPFLNFFNKKKININLETKKTIYKITKDKKLNKNILNEFESWIKIFNIWHNHGKKLFEKNRSIKKIFIPCWYFPDAMGLISAAKKFNILTYDMQHGIQGKYRPMYTDWQKIGQNGYELLPDFFGCWNKTTKKNILNSSNKRKNNIPIVIGNSWIPFYEKKLKIIHKKKNQKTILFCMQPPTSKNNEAIPHFIKNFIKSNYFKNYLFIFRFHPNSFVFKQEVENFVKNHKKKSQLKIDYGEYYILDALSNCTHHITAWSTTALEASYLGLNSAVYGQDSRFAFQHYIKKKFIKWLDGSNKNFIKWVSSDNYSGQKKISRQELFSNKINKQVFFN